MTTLLSVFFKETQNGQNKKKYKTHLTKEPIYFTSHLQATLNKLLTYYVFMQVI